MFHDASIHDLHVCIVVTDTTPLTMNDGTFIETEFHTNGLGVLANSFESLRFWDCYQKKHKVSAHLYRINELPNASIFIIIIIFTIVIIIIHK